MINEKHIDIINNNEENKRQEDNFDHFLDKKYSKSILTCKSNSLEI